MIFENGSGGTGRMAEENKVVPFETLVINKEEFEQLFLNFFIQYCQWPFKNVGFWPFRNVVFWPPKM